MRTLIDGYNVMYAGGLMRPKFGPDQFRQVRARFLSDLAAAIGPTEAPETTVVFDAVDGPGHLGSMVRYKGIAVEYAVDAESADERIEDLIAAHGNPRSLTVVSSDHRIRRAAARRKAKSLSADDFWVHLDASKARRLIVARPEPRRTPVPIPDEPDRDDALPADSDFWVAEFRAVIDSPEACEIARRDPMLPTDEEIRRIEREVEEEFRRR